MRSPLESSSSQALPLGELQRAFSGAIFSGDAAGVEALIRSDGIPAAQRVQIYRNNSRAGFLATLSATFPVIERLGGPDWFRQTAVDYQTRFPSRLGDLQYVGERFGDYLEQRFAGTDHAYFRDVARLEWAHQVVLTAADANPLDPAALAAVPAEEHERLVFQLRPATRLVESPYPILAIWKANQPCGDSPASSPDVSVALDAGPSRVLLIRRADFVELREVSAPTAILFKQLTAGAPFATAAAAVVEAHSDTALGESLRELIILETIRGYAL